MSAIVRENLKYGAFGMRAETSAIVSYLFQYEQEAEDADGLVQVVTYQAERVPTSLLQGQKLV